MHLVNSSNLFCNKCRIFFWWSIIILSMISACFLATYFLKGFLKGEEEPFRTVFLFFLVSSVILLRYAWVMKNKWPRKPTLAYFDTVATLTGAAVSALVLIPDLNVKTSEMLWPQATLALLALLGLCLVSTYLYLGFIFFVAWHTRSVSRVLFDKIR